MLIWLAEAALLVALAVALLVVREVCDELLAPEPPHAARASAARQATGVTTSREGMPGP